MTSQYNHQLKLDRALYHLHSLKTETSSWLKTEPYKFVHDLDSKTGQKLVVVELLEPVPREFAAITGDCLHNLRSALDNLAFSLAVRYSGTLPEKIARKVEFPIFTDRAMTSEERRNKIGRIDPEAQATIEKLQPYETGEKNAPNHILSVLHDLSIKDKHRVPHLGVAGIDKGTFFIPDPLAVAIEPVFKPIQDRSEVLRYFSAPEVWAKVDMKNAPTLYIALGQGSPKAVYRTRIESMLDVTHECIVTKILPPLLPYLA